RGAAKGCGRGSREGPGDGRARAEGGRARRVTEEARTLPCGTCEAPLPVDPTAKRATCRACGAVTAVPAAMRAEAHAFRDRIAAERSRIGLAEAMRRGFEDGLDRMIGWYMPVVFALA